VICAMLLITRTAGGGEGKEGKSLLVAGLGMYVIASLLARERFQKEKKKARSMRERRIQTVLGSPFTALGEKKGKSKKRKLIREQQWNQPGL